MPSAKRLVEPDPGAVSSMSACSERRLPNERDDPAELPSNQTDVRVELVAHVSVFRIEEEKIGEVWHHAGDLYAQDELFSWRGPRAVYSGT